MKLNWTIRNSPFIKKDSNSKPNTAPFTLWGILNCSVESFFDGNCVPPQIMEYAINHSKKLLEEGADIIDVGGMSTKPNAKFISSELEFSRIESVCRYLISEKKKDKNFYLSIDTSSSYVAEKLLSIGADIINDVTSFSYSAELPDILAQYKPGYVLVHPGFFVESKNKIYSTDLLNSMQKFFEKKMKTLVTSGLPEENIVLDPGIGFGKTTEESLIILNNIETLHSLGRPILLGISNKSIFGDILSLGLEERCEATDVLTALMFQKGVFHHRVHNVAAAKNALILSAILSHGGSYFE